MRTIFFSTVKSRFAPCLYFCAAEAVGDMPRHGEGGNLRPGAHAIQVTVVIAVRLFVSTFFLVPCSPSTQAAGTHRHRVPHNPVRGPPSAQACGGPRRQASDHCPVVAVYRLLTEPAPLRPFRPDVRLHPALGCAPQTPHTTPFLSIDFS